MIAKERKVGIEENRMCPVLDPKRIMATLDRIPDTIDPNSDPNWEYATNYEETDDGDFKEVPTGVRPVLKAAASYIAGDYTPEWESPEQGGSGFAVGVEMHLPDEQDTRSRFSLVLVASLLALLLLF
jgi:hypothetical protein